jgi:DMSO reductase anchor subunit
MVHVVGRRRSRQLRLIALAAGVAAPALLLLALPAAWPTIALAALLHGAGVLAARWLFFAEAEHVVGLYYGRR